MSWWQRALRTCLANAPQTCFVSCAASQAGWRIADEDGTPSLPVRIVSLDVVPECFTDGKAYDENGKECRWCLYDESDEDMVRRHPELRGKDGKMVPMIDLKFDDTCPVTYSLRARVSLEFWRVRHD